MVLEDTSNGEKPEATIEPMTPGDFKVVKKDKARFDSFNWGSLVAREVFKIRIEGDDKILGLMCIQDHPGEGINAIEIELLEVSKEHRGKTKNLDLVAGCLIAYACRESFKRGYEGFVFLVPKTKVIKNYQVSYGFIHMPITSKDRPMGFMMLDTQAALNLIRKYLD